MEHRHGGDRVLDHEPVQTDSARVNQDGTHRCSGVVVTSRGFYFGAVDRSIASVLYSDSLPRGYITGVSGGQLIESPAELGVPFPSQRRLLRQYFEAVGHPGDKLHIADPRRMLDDLHYVLDNQRQAQPITRDRFFSIGNDEVGGVGYDLPRAIFRLSQAGVRLLREQPEAMIYAVAFTQENYEPELLDALIELPNVREVQLSGTSVTDEDLMKLLSLRLLTGLSIDETQVTDKGLWPLRELPYLRYIESDGTKVTPSMLHTFQER